MRRRPTLSQAPSSASYSTAASRCLSIRRSKFSRDRQPSRLPVWRKPAREGESAVGLPAKIEKPSERQIEEFGRPCQDVSERPQQERPAAKGRAQRASLFEAASSQRPAFILLLCSVRFRFSAFDCYYFSGLLSSMDDATGDDCRNRRTLKRPTVEGRVAAL